MRFENVHDRELDWIWRESESFNHFRGTGWMPEPCRNCPEKEIDFGGCRCQAALLTGSADETDPVCSLSPKRSLVDRILANAESGAQLASWSYRRNPDMPSSL
jgi:pyrroloquinoline quinone biosynthesis protein E